MKNYTLLNKYSVLVITTIRVVQHLASSKNSTNSTISDPITAQSEQWFYWLQVIGVNTLYDWFESRFDCLRN